MTIHTGEFLGPESVLEDLRHVRPDRIGHGLAIFKSPELLALVQERQIPIEFCPTSNLRLGAVERLEEHPLRRALDLGLNFSINTDDPGVLGCSVQSEYALAADSFGFTVEDLNRVTVNSLGAAFAR
jgi:adenosine deaminase